MNAKQAQPIAPFAVEPALQGTLEALLRPVVEAAGFELIALRTVPGSEGGLTVQVQIDRWPGKGIIKLDDCTAVSRKVSVLLDEADPIPAGFDLEVSSPGMNRILRHEADFQRFAGMTAKVTTGEGATKESVTGVIEGCDQGVLALRASKVGVIEIAVAEVVKANLSPTIDEWQKLGQRLALESIEPAQPDTASAQDSD